MADGAARAAGRSGALGSVVGYFKDIGLGAWSMLDGMGVTLKNLVEKPVTQRYPKEMKRLPERTRGTLVLYADTEKKRIKCTVCLVCEVVCPNNSIHIEFSRDEATKKKCLTSYTWDSDKCIYCGLCVEGCNFSALGWTPEFERTVLDRKKLTWSERDMLRAWLESVARKRDPSKSEDVKAEDISMRWFE